GGSFGSISYSLGSGLNSSPPSQFSVNKETGEICTSLALDREHGQSSYDFTVNAVDGGGLSSVVYVKVDLVDINDNRPTFYPLSYAVSLSTQSAPGTSVVRVMAYDPDTGENGRVTYRTAPGGASPYFTLNKDTGVISLSRSLHGKANSVITMAISAQDGGGLVAPVNARVNISVVAGVVAPPVFQQSQYHFTVSEDSMRGVLVGVVQRAVSNPPCGFRLSAGSPKDILYTISSGDPTGYFSVDPDTGALRTSLPLDHEAQPVLDLELQACSGNPPAYGQTRVRVTVADVNDNAPLFLPSSSESVLLPEQTEMGAVVYRVQADDADSGVNGQLTFDLDLSAPGGGGGGVQRMFSVDRGSGEVRLAGSLSYESAPRFDLRVTARDGGVPQRSSVLTLVVHVQAENAQGPVFDTVSYRVELKEGTPLNTRFLQVRALDRETPAHAGPTPAGAPVYHLRPDGDAAGFGVAPDSGWLFVRSSLDREAKDMYLLTVLASAGHGQLKKTGSATVRVAVTDENDNAPRLTQERVFLAVKENLPAGTGFGRVAATDQDSGQNARLTYRFLQADRHFQINPQTGERVISTREALDREHQSSHQLLLSVQDGGSPPRSSTGTAFITVQDDNDNAPAFSPHTPGKILAMQVRTNPTPNPVARGGGGGGGHDAVAVAAYGRLCQRWSVLSLTRPSSPTDSVSLTFNSVEGATPGSVLGSVRLQGGDPPRQLTYTVVGGSDPDGTFAVDRHTGDVYLARPLDYERDARYTLQIEVDDPDPAGAGGRTLVRLDVDVADGNDHSPEFPEDPVTVVVSEGAAAGSSLFTFQASDGDGGGPNSELSYSVLRQWPDVPGLLLLDPVTGVLSLGRALDREATASLILVVQATDSAPDAGQRRRGSVTARLFVTDENDNAPAFSSPAAVSVMEDQPVGFVALYVVARDTDQGENGRVSYSIESGNAGGAFSLNPNTGSLSIFKPLDREEEETFNLTVVAKDHGTPQRTSSQLLCVHVIDVNDEVPQFEEVQYEAEIPENRPQGFSVLEVSAVDLDQGESVGDTSSDFRLDRRSGKLSTSRPLDRERKARYSLTVVAQDQGRPSLSGTVTVEVSVLDVNDHAPRFQSASYTADVSEDVQVGSFVLEVKAGDLDTGANGQVVYFLSGGSQGMFIVDQNTGRVITAAPLDREKTGAYNFDVHAADSSPSNPLNASAHVTVYIQDVNDNAPFFVQDPLVINVSATAGTSHRVLATMRAEDKDFGANGSVFYRFASPVRGFSINSLTGDIQATERLQALTQSQRTLIVEAMDQGSPSQSSLGVVIVYIREQSYRGIRFPRNARDVSVQENAVKGTAIIQTQAQYPDGSRMGITYSLFSGNKMQFFGINPTSGEIWVQNSEVLDFEETPRLRLVVKAETASSSSYMAVNLIIQDVNDNLPRFQLQNYVAYIREAQGYDFPIIQVFANDLDQGQNGQVSYSLRSSSMSSLFKIDPATGSVSTAAIMDREIWTHTKLVVMATDRGSPRLAGSATLTVIIVDLNDNSPTIPLPREVRVAEDTLVGTVITQVTGNDVDSGPALSYTLLLAADCQGAFGIRRYSGGVSLTAPLDYEERSWFTLTVRTSDSRHQSEANLTVLVEDVNDNAPLFTQDLYQVTVSEHHPAGSSVVTVTATDRDSADNGKVIYRVMSSTRDIFYIDSNNGTLFISQKAEFDVENPSILVVIEARDLGTPSLSSFATVQVQVSDTNDNAPVFHQSEYRASIPEDGPPGSTILTLEAVDADLSRDNCAFDFAIASGNTGNAFQIESSVRFLEGRGFQTVGNLILAEGLDFEAVASYNLSVVVSDRGVPQRSSSVPVLIGVLDANDNPPTLSRSEYSVVLSEGTAAGAEILHLSATDPDSAPNGEVQYSISSGDETGLFQVDRWTGALRLQKTLDRERRSVHVVVVQASDSQGHYALAPVTVEVKDVNDNLPYFPLKLLSASVRENQPQNALVTVLHAIDQDRGVFGQLRYYMLDDPKEQAFLINQTSGEVRTRTTFDYEKVNSFQFLAVAMDTGNYSATVTVQVYVTGEDEYDPAFTSSEFSFLVPEGARKGQSIGQVQALDEDEGVDGVVLYSLADSSQPYFEVNKTTGVIALKMDSYGRHSGRSKREVRTMTLDVVAHSPLERSRVATTHVVIDVTHTAFGLPSNMNVLLISVIAVSLGTIVILIVVAVALFFIKLRRRKKEHRPYCLPPPTATVLHKLEESKLAGNEMIYHQALPGYGPVQDGTGGGPYARGGSLDPSHSSGRGSAEAEAADDDEIRMINEYPRVSSISSSMQERISARGPDSGIQQDADQLSDISGEPSMDASQWYKAKKLGSLTSTLLAGQGPVYRDEGGGYLGVGRGLNISHPKDYAFPDDGKPPVDGSLTAIVASDEELRGSYNWDYLLNWCPQFQPLANVFTEIARLKDETAPPNPRRPFPHKAKAEPRIDPPPLITSVAHPGAKTVPPKPAVGRSFPHLASLRRSPLSSDGSISSAAMSPSFSPSLSPLAARSPAVTPFNVSQGPSASMISATEHHLEHSEEAEIRI
uniref:Dachsous cadherin-related 1a n=1 Tax=Gadus morhua TaxID=8049 RepID=A0A8C5BLR5_GADMO